MIDTTDVKKKKKIPEQNDFFSTDLNGSTILYKTIVLHVYHIFKYRLIFSINNNIIHYVYKNVMLIKCNDYKYCKDILGYFILN